MEAQRGSLSLLVLFLTVLLDSGTAGKSHSACKTWSRCVESGSSGFLASWFPHVARGDAQQVTHLT